MFEMQSPKDELAIQEIKKTSVEMSGWLKFIGVFLIIYGGLMALTIVGIIIAWLPIWMGVLLFSSGQKANDAHYTNSSIPLIDMIRKLKTYFIIQGVLLIIGLAVILFAIIAVSAGLITSLKHFKAI